jgi:hypothetical protein
MSRGKLGGNLISIFSKKDKNPQGAFDSTFPPWDLQAQEILGFVDPRMPNALTTLKSEVGTTRQDVIDERDAPDYAAALEKMGPFKTKVTAALLAKKKHVPALKEYDAAIKTLRPRDEVAKKVGPTPPEDLKDLYNKYVAAKNAVLIAQNNRDYPEANKKLKTLAGAIDALLKKRLPALLNAVNTAVGTDGTPDQAKDVVDKLAPEEIAGLGAKKQVGLLKTLRKNGNPTGAHFEARCKIYVCTPMDPTFAKADKKKRKKIIDTLKKDDKFKEAKKDWGTYTETKKRAFLQYAAKKQCEIMGHPGKDPVLNFIRTRKCRNTTLPCTDNCRTGTKREWDVGDDDTPTACPTCGDVAQFYGTLGECSPDSPATIVINTDSKLHMLDDLGTILDTVIHENTHAYQNKLIKDIDNGTLKEGDPDYNQALLFHENDKGYVNNSNTSALERQAYKNEPLEIHAMTMGPMVRDGLLGPKAERPSAPEADLS